MIERPEIVDDEHLYYLDSLRESGVVNMFGASPYLSMEFCLDKHDAKTILSYWMKSFGFNSTSSPLIFALVGFHGPDIFLISLFLKGFHIPLLLVDSIERQSILSQSSIKSSSQI